MEFWEQAVRSEIVAVPPRSNAGALLNATMCALLTLAVVLTGCFSGEAPLPPHEALAKAAQRIDAILAEDRATPAQAVPSARREAPDDAQAVAFWFYTHPLMSALLSRPETLARFCAAHPQVGLTRQFIGDWSVAIQKLTVSLAAGDLPDVALVKRSWLARLASSGLIAPLDALLPAALIEDLRAPARDALSVKGRLYAVPADGFCSVLFYNRDMVEAAAPRTWAELRDLARAAGRPDENPRKAVYGVGHLPFLETLWSAGGEVCDAVASGLDEAPAREALDFILALRDEHFAYPYGLGNPDGGFGLFLAGRAAMTVASSQQVFQARRAAFPVGIAPVPGKTGPISMLSDNAIVVFAKYAGAKRSAIGAVLDFLTGPDVQGADALGLGSVPARVSVSKDLAVPEGLGAAYSHARNTPLVGPWGAIEFEVGRYLDLAYRWRPPEE